MWSKISSTFRNGDGETSNAQQVALIGQVNSRTSSDEQTVHPRDVVADEVSPKQPEGAGLLSPPGPQGKNETYLNALQRFSRKRTRKKAHSVLPKG